jgi:coenzyme F420 hydrogenase subunit beta
MLAWAVNTGLVDCAVVTRMKTPFVAEAICTSDLSQIQDEETNSVYDYSPVLQAIPSDKTCAVVALPCQVEVIRHRQTMGAYKNVLVVIELVCNQVPHPSWREHILTEFGVQKQDVASLRYRGSGWPGVAEIVTTSGKTIFRPWPPLWDNYRFVSTRCRECPRVSCGGDFLAGDPWGIHGNMGAGKTLVFPGTSGAAKLLNASVAAGALCTSPVPSVEAERYLSGHGWTKESR